MKDFIKEFLEKNNILSEEFNKEKAEIELLKRTINYLKNKEESKFSHTVASEAVAQYNYTSSELKNFDKKINVCKWLTKLINTMHDGYYDFSIRKNGVMATPTSVASLACECAYNYYLLDAAEWNNELNRTIELDYSIIDSDGKYVDKKYSMPLSFHGDPRFTKEFIDTGTGGETPVVDWYLGYPYTLPLDFMEQFMRHRLISYNYVSATSGVVDVNTEWKLAANSIACFDARRYDSEKYTDDVRYVVTVLGAGPKFVNNLYRTNMPEQMTYYGASSNTISRYTCQVTANTLACNLFMKYVLGKNPQNDDIDQYLYANISKVDKDGMITVLYENNLVTNNTSFRFHFPTCCSQLAVAKYLEAIDPDDIVDFEYETMKSYELSRPALIQPLSTTTFGTLIVANTPAGIQEYGNNTTLYNMTGSIEDVFRCSCCSDNTYCTYALILHLYKHLNSTPKNTSTPLIESISSWDNGHIEISFPEIKLSNINTSTGESTLAYSSEVHDHLAAPSTPWEGMVQSSYKDYTYKINLSKDYVDFKDFELSDYFTLTLVMRYCDMRSSTAKTRTLIANLGDTKIYLLKYAYHLPEITTREDPSYFYASNYRGIEIQTGKNRYYQALNVIDATSTLLDEVVVTISYMKGLWDIQTYNQWGGRN